MGSDGFQGQCKKNTNLSFFSEDNFINQRAYHDFLEYFLYNIKNEILSCSYNTNSSRETFYMYNT